MKINCFELLFDIIVFDYNMEIYDTIPLEGELISQQSFQYNDDEYQCFCIETKNKNQGIISRMFYSERLNIMLYNNSTKQKLLIQTEQAKQLDQFHISVNITTWHNYVILKLDGKIYVCDLIKLTLILIIDNKNLLFDNLYKNTSYTLTDNYFITKNTIYDKNFKIVYDNLNSIITVYQDILKYDYVVICNNYNLTLYDITNNKHYDINGDIITIKNNILYLNNNHKDIIVYNLKKLLGKN